MKKGKLAYNISDSPDPYPTGLFVINKFGVIFNANKSGLSLISSKNDNILNKNFLDYLDEYGKNNFQRYFYKASNSSEPQIAELNFRGIDNNYFPALLIAKSVTFSESTDKFCSIAIIDLTSSKMKSVVRQQDEDRFEKMANTAPVMIWIADVEGLFSFVNRVWLDFTGKEIGDQLGMNWLKNVHPDDYENLLNIYQDAFSSRKPFSVKFRFMGINEKYNWMLIKGTPRLNDEENFSGFIGSCVNINDQIENEEKIKKINAKLTESNETKDKFFSIISHDLKSPLSGLMGILEILDTSYETLQENEKIEIITEAAKSSKSTYALIENLLEWSSVKSDKLPFEPKKVNLLAVINNIGTLYNQNFKNKGITLKVNVKPETTVFTDIKIIETIFRNLISNAIKFTAQNGSVLVNSKEDKNFTVIQVNDTGIGMDQDEMEKLFRIDKSHSTRGTDDEEGTGLGLILCKELVEKQGGKIWVVSKKGEGSTFYFTLPAGN
jgi:PAS domain S-box-containing protein